MRRSLALALLFHTAGIACAAPGYWGAQDSGWYWYEAAPVPVPEAVAEPEPEEETAVVDDVPPELARHVELKKRLEETRVIAIMEPTPENLEEYLYVQREVMDRSARFADVWQRVVWANPELDYQFTHRPTNAAALHTWETVRREDRDGLIARAAKDHGLFVLFGPDCDHCGQIAHTLRRFSLRHGFEVQAIAVGGASHGSFPGAWDDNGFAASAGIDSFPALVLAKVKPGEEEAVPIAYGPLAESELEERVAVLTGVPVGARF